MTTNLDQRTPAPSSLADRTGSDAVRMDRARTDQPGATVWLTGLPSAGKSTIAHALAAELAAAGTRVQVLDGDEVRPYLSTELGFSKAHRDLNVTRIGYVARLLASHGVVVLVPVIAPYAATRDQVRADHTSHGVPYAEVHVATSLAVAESRDVKGLYAKARKGELSGLTGLDDPYEPPADPELVIDTAETDLAASVGLGRELVESLTGTADDKESR
jgi:adenylylsulfate kinase